MKIGEKIRSIRKSKDMTLKGLSSSSGVEIATLSRIETGKMSGTIKSHQAIAAALGISLMQLYGDIDIENKSVDFQSQKNRTESFIHNNKAAYHMLTARVLSKKMMPVILKIEPGGVTSAEELPKQTEKFVYVLNGSLKITVGPKTHNLKQGETLYFDASLKHYFKNTSGRTASAICVISPPAL